MFNIDEFTDKYKNNCNKCCIYDCDSECKGSCTKDNYKVRCEDCEHDRDEM